MDYSEALDNDNILERCDIFGIGINIRFNKQEQHKTKIGGIVTIIMLGLLIYQLKIIVDNQMDTTSPIVLQEQSFTPEPARYDLTPDRFMMTFGLQNSTSHHYIDPSVYNLTLTIKSTMKTLNPANGQYTANTNIRVVQIEPCSIDHFTIPSVNSYFLSLSYQNMYCISKSETSLFLQGEFDALHYSTLELLVNQCTLNCNPNMNALLGLNRLAVYYVDYAVIPSSKNEPFQPLGRESFWVGGPEFTKLTAIMFRNSYLNSDYGLIGQSIEQRNALTLSTDKEYVSSKTGTVLFDCFIQLEKNINNIYHRSYQKLDRSISQIGGIFNILFTIGIVICRPLSQIELNLKLINKLFKIEDNHDRKEGNGKDQLQLEKSPLSQKNNSKENIMQQADIFLSSQETPKADFKSAFQSKLLSPSIQKSGREELQQSGSKIIVSNSNPVNKRLTTAISAIEKCSTQIQQEMKPNPNSTLPQLLEREKLTNELKKFFSFSKESISFKGWEYFLNFFRFSNICKSRRSQLLSKGVEKLYNQIDIFYLIQKLQEVEKLKRLLLNENQIKLFEYIPKPVLQMEEKKATHVSEKVGILFEDKTDLLQKTNNAQQAFSNITSQNIKPSKIDIRILELLDPRFRIYLQEKGDQQDMSTLQKPFQNVLDMQKQSASLVNQDLIAKDLFSEIMPIASERDVIKCHSQDQIYSPRKSLAGLYNSSTKINQKNQFNF